MKSSPNKDNWMLRNLVRGLVFVIAVIIVPNIFLSIFTQHNVEIRVPDLRALDVDDASVLAKKSGVTFIIQDSTYVNDLRPGAVFSQNPKPGTKVKRKRKVRVVINAVNPRMVKMPSLDGYSLRRACEELSSKGLVVGRLNYVHDLATNSVLAQYLDGEDIEGGTMVCSGSVIDLELGLNPYDSRAVIPNLAGVPYPEAVELLKMNSFNVGGLHFDDTVESYVDSLNATVYSQWPLDVTLCFLRGTNVSLYFSLDTSRVSPYLKSQIEAALESTQAQQ